MVATQITMRGHTTDEQQTQHQASKLLIYFHAKYSKRAVRLLAQLEGSLLVWNPELMQAIDEN